ncbi:Predicted transcriptional regulator, ArsR family [Frankineae bacterium MT45]|nr:Predicted transcriptional regulator, ArsR family [Frankineae bacterium MT45]
MKFNPGSPTGARHPELGAPASETGGRDSTRDTVARIVLERGPQSAADIAHALGLSAAGVRRHLEALVSDGILEQCTPRRVSSATGPGRPARAYQLTDAGRASFPHAYDDLATTALRYLDETGGADAVTHFADHRAAILARSLAPSLPAASVDPATQADALAAALTGQGYAANVQSTPAGVQICQHHCPVAHVAAQFPQLCEAETRAFEQLLGTNVQRLATIAHGDGVCTTHFADRSRVSPAGVTVPARPVGVSAAVSTTAKSPSGRNR